MTTIACNREELYGDQQFSNHATGSKFKGKTKVYYIKAHEDIYPEDFIVGFAGTASDIVTVISYYTSPELFPRAPRVRNLKGLVLTASKNIFMFDDYDKWLAVDQPFYAIGTGASYAIGAMSLGVSPKDAVKAAMKFDIYTGYGTKGYSIN